MIYKVVSCFPSNCGFGLRSWWIEFPSPIVVSPLYTPGVAALCTLLEGNTFEVTGSESDIFRDTNACFCYYEGTIGEHITLELYIANGQLSGNPPAFFPCGTHVVKITNRHPDIFQGLGSVPAVSYWYLYDGEHSDPPYGRTWKCQATNDGWRYLDNGDPYVDNFGCEFTDDILVKPAP